MDFKFEHMSRAVGYDKPYLSDLRIVGLGDFSEFTTREPLDMRQHTQEVFVRNGHAMVAYPRYIHPSDRPRLQIRPDPQEPGSYVAFFTHDNPALEGDLEIRATEWVDREKKPAIITFRRNNA